MKKKKQRLSPHGNLVVILEIPLDQLITNKPRPRSEEEKEYIQKLAVDIEHDGLRSLPRVYFSYTRAEKHFYCIHKGVNRWRAFKLLDRDFLICVVVPLFEMKRMVAP